MIGAFFDVVGTIYRGGFWRDISDYQREKKRNRFWVWWYLIWHMAGWPLNSAGILGKSRWYESWARDMAWLFRGLTLQEADEMFDWVIEERVVPNLRTDVMEILRDHQAKGHVVALISGSPQELLDAMASRLGVDHVLGSPLETHQGRYTGKMAGSVTMSEGKVDALKAWLAASGLEIDWQNSFAYGDGHTDVHFLERVGHPAAVYPDEGLKAVAEERGWRIIGEREPRT
ncbi:MAG TPA: HAD-IB family hydrolase [Anaerolineae bacterium]|nr:HAD-IB family hydrolase [Anaerolineae bacterium]